MDVRVGLWRRLSAEELMRLNRGVGEDSRESLDCKEIQPVHCSMYCSNCYLFTCIQISQEASQVVWYSHLFKNFPQSVVIHSVKGFSIVSEAELDVFWNSLAFSMIQRMLAIWSLVSLPFLNSACTSGRSQFTYCWNLAWRISSITLLACEMSRIVQFKHSLALPFFGIGMKTDLFQSCGHCWAFQICWHIECSTLTASLFRIWNSSTGIPSPPLALFIVMLPKAHLTSHSRISGSR